VLALERSSLYNGKMCILSVITGEEGYIFVNSSKNPFYSHDIIGVNFQKLLTKCGVKARVLYNLRHIFTLQLISKGANIV